MISWIFTIFVAVIVLIVLLGILYELAVDGLRHEEAVRRELTRTSEKVDGKDDM